ncbi:MAG: hypothetical protein RMK40_05740 [Chloroflexota bacterium]|nr:hypothetical protein [Chloroflexota bacterium]
MVKGRLEAELEEILRKADRRVQRKARRPWRWPRLRASFTPSALLVLGVLALVAAVVAQGPLRGWGTWVFWGGVVLLLAAYATYWARRTPRVEKRWRGRPVDDSEGWWRRVRRLFRR